jgi:hypothetical protein
MGITRGTATTAVCKHRTSVRGSPDSASPAKRMTFTIGTTALYGNCPLAGVPSPSVGVRNATFKEKGAAGDLDIGDLVLLVSSSDEERATAIAVPGQEKSHARYCERLLNRKIPCRTMLRPPRHAVQLLPPLPTALAGPVRAVRTHIPHTPTPPVSSRAERYVEEPRLAQTRGGHGIASSKNKSNEPVVDDFVIRLRRAGSCVR